MPICTGFKLSLLCFSSAALLATASPLAEMESRSSLADVITSCTTPNTIALTFDDGPWLYHQKIADLLTKYGAKGTFFVNGDNYDCIYTKKIADSIVYSYNAGHQIASHTWAHKHLTELSDTDIMQEMTKTDTALTRILGVKPSIFRPPYGEYNDDVRQIAKKNGQFLVNWDLDSGDANGNTPTQSKHIYDSALKRNPSTLLPLNHETYKTTLEEVIPHVLKTWGDKGYSFVTVAECLGIDAYLYERDPFPRDSSTWKC